MVYTRAYKVQFRTLMKCSINLNEQLQADQLTRIRFIEGRILPLPTIFESYLETFGGLLTLNNRLLARNRIDNDDHAEIASQIHNLMRQCKAYERNAQFLLKRITSTAQLISDGLALKSQHAAKEQNELLMSLARTSQVQNESICEMTQAAVRDSATIRVITIATLIFLPTTFVAVCYPNLCLRHTG